MERLEKLSTNLTHALVDVRLRAAQNLQFKLLSNVLGDGVYSSAACMTSLADGISDAIQMLLSSNDWQGPTTTASKLMEELLQLARLIGGKSNMAPAATNESFAKLLEKLYVVFSKCSSSDPMHNLIQQCIESVCTIKAPSMDAQLLSSTAGDFTPVPRHLLHTPLTGGVLLGGAALDAGPSSNEKLQRGAGAILQSALVYSGWKFSKVVLTDSDERHLFDLEVKIKLGHDSSVQLLWDALSDFPAPVLMSRPGLMVAVLDLVGAVFTQDQLAANPGGLNPLTAMAWLEGLVRKSAAAFVTHLDGSLCSSVPESSQALKPVDDEGAIDYGKPSLAAEMTRAMYSLRYPTLRAEGSEAESQAELNKSAAAAPLRVSPAPSLPGLSFASCAAALPLLQGRDPLIAARVLSLLQTALPYIREPAVAESASSSSAAAAAAASAELSLTDRKRIQHLLNRVEQLLRFFEARPLSVDRVLSLCLPLTDEEKLAAAPGEEQDKVLRVQDAAFESALLRAVVEVLVVVPVDSVRPMPEAASDADKADGSLLDVGPLTLDIAKDLVSSGGGSAQLLEVGEDSSVEATLTSLLRRADPVAMDGVTYASELLQSIAALQGMTELGESPNDHVPARFLLSKLLGKAHVVANLLDCGSDALLDEMTELGGSVPEIAVVLLAVAVSRCAEQNKDLVLRDADVCSAVSLLARLSCCCGAAMRVETYSCLLGVLTAGQSRGLSAEQVELLKALKFKAFPLHHLLAALASPNFVHSVVLFGLLGADSADIAYGQDNTQLVVSGSDPPVPEALLIVEHLLTFVLTSSGLDVAVAEAWSPLLGPLKVCEWGWSSSSEPALRLPQAVLSFITLLEDCCAASAGSSKARTAYGMALSLGLFHGVAAVRARCAVRLRYELVGLKAAAYEHEGGAALDPFADLGDEVSSLISWGALQTTGPAAPAPPAVSRIPSRLVNHSECRKLASIAFSGSHDAGIRASAVRQLVEMLADKHLVATAEAGWCVAVASGCSKALSAIPWGSSETLQAAPLADYKLALEAAALLRALVCESEAVRAAVVFWPQANSKGSGREEDDDELNAPSMDVSLWPLLSAALRVAPSAAQPGRPKPPQEGEAALKEAQALCVQVLAILAHDGGRWSDSLSPAPAYVALAHSGFVREYATVPAASSGGSGGSSGHEGATSVRVPTFLSSSFGYALPRVPGLSAGLAPQAIARLLAERGEDGRADVWPFQVSVMRCEMGDRSSGRARPLPSKRVMSLVARAAFAPSPQSLLSTVAAALCAAVATADSHKSLRALLHALGSLGAALPGLCGALVVEDLRLALSRLLSVPPRTKNDLVTLTAALSLLTQVTQACHGYHQAAVGSGQDSAWEVTQAASVLLDEVSSAVLAPLLPVLMDFKESTAGAALASLSPSFTSRDHVMKDKSVEESFARQQAHLAVLDLLDALSAVPYPLLSLAPSLADHALPHYLAQMVASELLPSSRRAKAASILESLVVRHGVRAALVCPLPNHLDAAAWDVLAVGPGKDSVSLDLVLKSIRLLRTPDSLRGNGSLLSSLRLFFCCLTQFSSDSGASDEEGRWWRRVRDWGWIMRLGWDRRSEVRLLTVSILQALLPVLPEVQGKSLAITMDSLEGHAADSPNRGLGGSSEWPPVESLTHVMLDCSEAHAVRAVALQSVVACSNGVPAEQLISAALDLIGAPSTQFSRMQSSASVSAPSSSAALSALYTVVTTYPAAEVAAAAKSLKMLPAIMSLVRNDVRSEMQQAALRRVGLLGPEDERATSLFPEGKRAGGAVRSSVRHFSLLGGWDACWLHFLRDKCEVSGSLAQAAACRVLSVLGSASVQANVPFLHAAKQTSLVRGLVSLLCSMDFLLQAPAKSGLTVAADHRTAAASDLLYALLSSEQGSEALSGLLQAEPFIAGLVVRRLTIRLEQLTLDAAGASALSSSAAASAASTLKVLCALLDNSVFAALLADLDWPGMDEDGQPQRPSPVSECTGALLRLRVGVLDAEGATGLLGLRLDVAIGFWCQHFPSAQAALCQATQPGLSDVAFPLLDHYCEAVGEAAADLVAQQQAPAESALQAQQTADMKRSLRTLKKRTSAAQGPSINKPTVNPKWRNAARGYSASSVPSSSSSPKPEPRLSSQARAKTWAALIALAGCLGHPSASRRAAEVGLQSSLAVLVKMIGTWGTRDVAQSKGGPSNAELAGAVLAACSTFVRNSSEAKAALAAAGESIVSATTPSHKGLSPEGREASNVLHQMVNLALYAGSVQGGSRNLLLSLASALLRAPASPTLQKAAVAHVLALSLQRSLSTKTADQSSTPHLLHALASCLVAEAQAGGGMTSVVGRDITNTIASLAQPVVGALRDGRPEAGPSDADFKPVSVPQLLQWVSESFSDQPDVLAAAVRCSAALASVGSSPGSGQDETSTATPAAKRLFSVAGSKESISLIVGAASSKHPALAAVASVALWVLVHCSSQALANAKALVAPAPLAEVVGAVGRRADGPYSPHAVRARSNLMELLSSSAVQSV